MPSLLPRSALMQGLLGGDAFAVGWAVGSVLAQVWDLAWRRSGRFGSAPGHGHNYNPDFAGAWAAVSAPSGWAPGDTDRLANALLSVPLT